MSEMAHPVTCRLPCLGGTTSAAPEERAEVVGAGSKRCGAWKWLGEFNAAADGLGGPTGPALEGRAEVAGVGQKGGGGESSTRAGAGRFWGPCSVSGSTA